MVHMVHMVHGELKGQGGARAGAAGHQQGTRKRGTLGLPWGSPGALCPPRPNQERTSALANLAVMLTLVTITSCCAYCPLPMPLEKCILAIGAHVDRTGAPLYVRVNPQMTRAREAQHICHWHDNTLLYGTLHNTRSTVAFLCWRTEAGKQSGNGQSVFSEPSSQPHCPIYSTAT